MNGKKELPYENWGEEERRAFTRSDLEGGADLHKLPVGKGLEIETKNTIYLLERREDGFYVSGNQKHCPQPTKVTGLGSNFGGSAFRPDLIGRGMFMEFVLPRNEPGEPGPAKPIVTSEIMDVREVELPKK